MRSRLNTVGFRKIQFHRGNPESPANPESTAMDKYNEIEKKKKNDEVQESVNLEGNLRTEEVVGNRSLVHATEE